MAKSEKKEGLIDIISSFALFFIGLSLSNPAKWISPESYYKLSHGPDAVGYYSDERGFEPFTQPSKYYRGELTDGATAG